MSSTTSIPKTGRAAVLTHLGNPYDLQDFPVKQPSELAIGECLIKMEYAGCCHSDLHVRDNDWGFPVQVPLVGGHEGIGRVVAIGEHTQTSVKVGDRVGLKWIALSCLRYLSSFDVSFSPDVNLFLRYLGVRCASAGGRALAWSNVAMDVPNTERSPSTVSFTDYVTPIPESLDPAAATPILCAGITIYKAIKETKATIGEWVAISGAGGGLGHLDTGSSKKELCAKLGADKWIDFMESKDVVKDVQEATGGLGPHAAVIAVGNPTPFNQALMYLRPTGTLVCAGVPVTGTMLQVPLTMFVPKCLHIVGTATGNRQDMTEALDIVASGKVKCHHVVKPLSEVNDVMEEMSKGNLTGRVVFKI
ncbi:hypothetical protein AAF712_007073 [Marasmius tenuissimus]|uniref:alcohol dehydrogenase n=1 Tax=Marasmius tenuissimus TaxID=585030 RepID=A0ABR2ZW38_9AGAR